MREFPLISLVDGAGRGGGWVGGRFGAGPPLPWRDLSRTTARVPLLRTGALGCGATRASVSAIFPRKAAPHGSGRSAWRRRPRRREENGARTEGERGPAGRWCCVGSGQRGSGRGLERCQKSVASSRCLTSQFRCGRAEACPSPWRAHREGRASARPCGWATSVKPQKN